MNSMFLTDGYKLDHRRQYPEGTEFVYSNLTARSAKHFLYQMERYLMVMWCLV